MFGEEFDGLVYCHFQYIIDVLILEFHFQCICFKTFTVTGFAFQHQVCHKLHFYGDGSFAFTFLASSAFAVETEMSGCVSHLFCQRLFRP